MMVIKNSCPEATDQYPHIAKKKEENFGGKTGMSWIYA